MVLESSPATSRGQAARADGVRSRFSVNGVPHLGEPRLAAQLPAFARGLLVPRAHSTRRLLHLVFAFRAGHDSTSLVRLPLASGGLPRC